MIKEEERQGVGNEPSWEGMYLLLGKRIQELRKGMGFNQQVLAEFSHLTLHTISRIERAAQPCKVHELLALSDALNVNPWDLLFEEKQENVITAGWLNRAIKRYAEQGSVTPLDPASTENEEII